MKKMIYIARVADDNSDAYRATFDKAEARRIAESYKAHLTDRERRTHTVTVEGYMIEIADGETRDAQTLWDDMLIDDTAPIDADEYEEV